MIARKARFAVLQPARSARIKMPANGRQWERRGSEIGQIDSDGVSGILGGLTFTQAPCSRIAASSSFCSLPVPKKLTTAKRPKTLNRITVTNSGSFPKSILGIRPVPCMRNSSTPRTASKGIETSRDPRINKWPFSIDKFARHARKWVLKLTESPLKVRDPDNAPERRPGWRLRCFKRHHEFGADPNSGTRISKPATLHG